MTAPRRETGFARPKDAGHLSSYPPRANEPVAAGPMNWEPQMGHRESRYASDDAITQPYAPLWPWTVSCKTRPSNRWPQVLQRNFVLLRACCGIFPPTLL